MQQVSAELQQQLQALGINPSDDVFRTGSEEFDHNGLSSPIPQEVRFMNAELRRCPVEGVGMVLAIFSGSGAVYEFVRTLRKCIYGKVKHAVRLQMTPNGTFVRTQFEVAIKVMSKVSGVPITVLRRAELALTILCLACLPAGYYRGGKSSRKPACRACSAAVPVRTWSRERTHAGTMAVAALVGTAIYLI
jgi:hypothetical protein